MQNDSRSLTLAAVWLFFIILGPDVASPVYKLMYLGSSTREINEGVSRIDRILENQPVSEPACPKIPATYDIEFRHVSFSYENKEQATRTERCTISVSRPLKVKLPLLSVRREVVNLPSPI